MFDQLKGVTMFSNIELRSGYHQVHIKEDEIYKMDFWTRYGNYEFFVVPFILTNAQATFIFLKNNVLHPYLDKFGIVFIDDIVAYYKYEEEHAEHLAKLLRFLREHQLYSKLNKCNFLQTEVLYLGHVVSKEGIKVDLKNIRAITVLYLLQHPSKILARMQISEPTLDLAIVCSLVTC